MDGWINEVAYVDADAFAAVKALRAVDAKIRWWWNHHYPLPPLGHRVRMLSSVSDLALVAAWRV